MNDAIDSIDAETCPNKTVLRLACSDCEAVRPAIEKLIASRKQALECVKARWKRSRRIMGFEVDAIDRELEMDPVGYKLARNQLQCVRDALDRGLWPLERLADAFRAKNARMLRERAWAATVPVRYRETEIDRLPQPDVARAVLALHRSAGCPPSAFIYGPSGAGKTRTALLIAKHYFLGDGLEFRFLEASTIADVAVARSRSGGMVEWCDQLVKTDLLIIDEVGQGTFSNSYGEALRRILERCTANGISLILTSQFDLRGLHAKWAGEDAGKGVTASAIIRRIDEFLTPVRLERRARK